MLLKKHNNTRNQNKNIGEFGVNVGVNTQYINGNIGVAFQQYLDNNKITKRYRDTRLPVKNAISVNDGFSVTFDRYFKKGKE